MSLGAKIMQRFRKRLTRWVENERRVCGCATQAVKRVAGKLKMSPATVYRAMNGYGEVQIKAHHYAALLMHSLGIVKAAASRMRSKRTAQVSEELTA
jgi:PII-like signaling protein